MNKVLLIITIILALIAIGLGAFLYSRKAEVPLPIIEKAPEVQTYANTDYGLSFAYPLNYYLKERNAGTAERPQLSLVLVEDTQENRDVIEGHSTEARDGPTAITVDAYPNPDRLTADDWVRADTNWTIRTSEAAPIGKGKITGVTYTWSGLYEGKTVVVTNGIKAYVFSVTWMTPTDPILVDFDALLSSVELTP